MPSVISAGTTAGTAIAIAGDTTGNLAFQTNGTTTAMTINTSQNVGIGTTSPSTKLDTRGVISAGDGTNSLQIGAGWAGTGTQCYVATGGSNTQIIFGTNGTEQMRITSDGNLVMASRSGAGNTNQLQVGTTASSSGVNAYGSFIADASSPYPLGLKALSSSQGVMGIFSSANAVIGSISVNGSATAFNTSSDYRLKENIAPMTGALDKVQQLKPCTYTWKLDGKNGQGFIAHELAEVIPDAVVGEKDAVETYTDDEGNEQTRIKPQGVDTSFLVATLTAAIQELKAELDATKAEVQALKGVA